MNEVLNNMRNALNRKVCRQLIKTMSDNGFECIKADDENIKNKSIKYKVDMVFDLDGADIIFKKADKTHYVVFCAYNTGIECIADWGYAEGDADGFSAIMDKFTGDTKWEMNQ